MSSGEQPVRGVSHWLFAGQMAASTGFVIYSVLQGDWVFVASNVMLLITALVGQLLFVRNRRHGGRRSEIRGEGGANRSQSLSMQAIAEPPVAVMTEVAAVG